ncbi:MAG: tRNA 2-selenouridine(34) synthase MnmH [Chitinophagaceae bacterium]
MGCRSRQPISNLNTIALAIEKIDIDQFIALYKSYPVLDVRSPGEYAHAHIPGAVSLPLFTDEERKVVGTIYKQQSQQDAIKSGLQYFGPKMVRMIETVEALLKNASPANELLPIDPLTNGPLTVIKGPPTILVHCWRGGMRSAGVAWLLSLYGYRVFTIVGGYKAYRGWVRRQFEVQYPFHVLGGYTGSGKTVLLNNLEDISQPVIDLEHLAGHKGSAFGKIGLPPQPSQEMFENLLAEALFKSSGQLRELPLPNSTSPENRNPITGIWVEDESQRIGDIMLPDGFWNQLRSSPIFFIDIPFEERLDFLVQDYAKGQVEEFVNAIIRIKKRLGGLEAKTAIHHLLEGEIKEAYRVLLAYYDKWYRKGLNNRDHINDLLETLPFEKVLSERQVLELMARAGAKKKAASKEGTA